MTDTISNSDDYIDVRDVIARVGELRAERDVPPLYISADEVEELATLEALLSDLAGNGGDEQWEGDWYPVPLIRDSYFKRFAMQFADDIGAIDGSASWPNNCIDWERATRELRMEFSSVEFDGVTYWYR